MEMKQLLENLEYIDSHLPDDLEGDDVVEVVITLKAARDIRALIAKTKGQ